MAVILTEDFSGGTWATNWTTEVNAAGSFGVSAGLGNITIPNSTTAWQRAIDNKSTRVNQEILVKWSRSTTLSKQSSLLVYVGVSGLGAGPFTFTDGAALYFGTTGTSVTVNIQAKRNSSLISGGVLTAGTINANVTNWIRLRMEGGVIKARWWEDGTSEPASWTYTYDASASAPFPSGRSGVGAYEYSSTNANQTFYFDDITIDDTSTAAPVHGGYTAQAMTASGTLPNPAVSTTTVISASHNAAVMTASATMPGGTGRGNVQTLTVVADTVIDRDTGEIVGGTMTSTWNGGDPRALAFRSDNPTFGVDEEVTSAKLRVYVTAFSNDAALTPATVSLYKFNATWTDSGTGSVVSRTFVTNISHTFTSGWNEIDITPIVNLWKAGEANNGFALYCSAFTVQSRENTNKPQVRVTTGTAASVSVPATVLTGSATIPDASISTDAGASIAANPFVATGSLVNPAVSVIRHVNVVAGIAEGSALMGESGFAVPAGYDAQVMTANASLQTDVSVEARRNVNPFVEPATATARWGKTFNVNGNPILIDETEDPYFARVIGQWTPNTPNSVWLRLADGQSSVIAADRWQNLHSNIQPHEYTYTGVDRGRFDGPAGRHNVRFTGSGHIRSTNAVSTVLSTTVERTTVELTFKTTKKNQFIMGGEDEYNFLNQISSSGIKFYREFRLKNGRIDYRAFDSNVLVGEMVGFRDLADNQWHHLVIRGGADAVEIFVDGTLEIRRLSGNFGIPQYPAEEPVDIAGTDTRITIPEELGGTPKRPQSDWFVGEMTEFVGRENYHLSDTDIQRNYYHVMGYNPFYAEPAEATAEATQGNKGRGNQKRALYLFYNFEPVASTDPEAQGNYLFPEFMTYDGPLAGYRYKQHTLASGPYIYFRQSIRHRMAASNSGQIVVSEFRDQITDEPRWIDLDQDVDLDDFDLIIFHDWPKTVSEADRPKKDKLVRQLREAVEEGTSLFVNNRHLAIDLGIVDRVEFCLPLTEGFNSRNTALNGDLNAFPFASLYDYGSAKLYPWDAAGGKVTQGTSRIPHSATYAGQPQFLDLKARAFFDTHKNSKFRVRALIDGLTSIPGPIWADAAFYYELDAWGDQMTNYRFLHRPNGLQIGDEFLYWGSDLSGTDSYAYESNPWLPGVNAYLSRYAGAWATPLANVKVGTVVTTFAAKHWLRQAEVDNPYRDYATTIAIEPHDEWGGRPSGGKVFVDFTETPKTEPIKLPYHQVPENVKATLTPEQREWEWSMEWISATNTPVNAPMPDSVAGGTATVINGEMLGGKPATIGSGGSAVGTPAAAANLRANLVSVDYFNEFPAAFYNIYSMFYRGLLWLSEKVEIEEGSEVIRPAKIEASASMPNATVRAEKSAVVGAQPMNATARLVKPEEDPSGDAEVMALPMTATARFVGYGTSIAAEPMTAQATLVENVNAVFAGGEQVVVYMTWADPILFMREEV